MSEPNQRDPLVHLLLLHPQITIAYYGTVAQKPVIFAHTNPALTIQSQSLPKTFSGLPIIYRDPTEIRDLRLHGPCPLATNPHQACQDEPIQLGCQIQPAGANWLGTAGAPVHSIEPNGDHLYGVLSNWHVMVPSQVQPNHPQHQPDTNAPAMAYLNRFWAVSPNQGNLVDCAFANAFKDGFHTIAKSILGIGEPNPQPGTASIGLQAMKAGRTTAVTTGRCSAVGAAVQVNYGDFVALFTDQDVFEPSGAAFSAAGDSGSLILCQSAHRPLALLFAGGGDLTIGNPIRHIIDALEIDFRFP